jgi:hypothetical protein
VQIGRELGQVRIHIAARGHHAAQVAAEAEILALAPQQHRAHVGIFAHGVGGGRELAAELQVHGVRRIRTRRGEVRDVLANVQAYRRGSASAHEARDSDCVRGGRWYPDQEPRVPPGPWP